MDGWRVGERDDARKMRPSLVAYDELTDEVKEYDRIYVRGTQNACLNPASDKRSGGRPSAPSR